MEDRLLKIVFLLRIFLLIICLRIGGILFLILGLCLFIGRFCVTICIGLLPYLILNFVPYYKESIFSVKFPALIIMLFSFVCSACIIDMYNSLTDAFLICYFIGEGSNTEYYEFKEKLM